MQKTSKQPLFDLGQLVATPGALAALEKTGQSAMEFLSRHVTGDGENSPRRTGTRTNSAWKRDSASLAASGLRRATNSVSLPKRTAPIPPCFCPKSTESKHFTQSFSRLVQLGL